MQEPMVLLSFFGGVVNTWPLVVVVQEKGQTRRWWLAKGKAWDEFDGLG